MNITIGATYTHTATVTAAQTAGAMGSGFLDVFATPMMIALMEHTAAHCLGPFLPDGQSSVGTAVNVTHDAATPVGMKVTFTAEIVAVDRRRVDFRVTARDEVEQIGAGTHTRFIVDNDKFSAKAAQKGK